MCENVSLTTVNMSIKNDIRLVLVKQAHKHRHTTDLKSFYTLLVLVHRVVVIYLLFNNTT